LTAGEAVAASANCIQAYRLPLFSLVPCLTFAMALVAH